MIDDDLKNRTRWAINYVCQRDKLTNESLSNLLKINTSNISQYRAKRIRPSAEFMKVFCNYFDFSEAWFLSGQGEPFRGARKKYEEICGPVEPGMICEDMDSYDLTAQKINIEEAIGKTYKILNAGTSLSFALYMNIQQFATALETDQVLKVCQEQISDLQKQINELKQEVDDLTTHPVLPKKQMDE
jgi:transcriptional regulator with XRE-family HTH domain